ncbi:iron complex transport system substrate-binding protein [Propionispora hippei DSM 15287]|uniref:Iron complex transport system substrate-binding protein n=2 Tax=Propionispora TaxID=112902 RepID=A0A1M6KB02_9FIRM|nr:iron complex transport system substrate-binding protein [Propionispora hippei DSM 15287]
MKKPHKYLLLATCSLLLLAAGCQVPPPATGPAAPAQTTSGYPVTIQNYDAGGHPISTTYTQPPSRVVVTHPGATELLLELGLENHILASVAPYGPPLKRLAGKYANLPLTKALYAPSQEELVLMQPDLIIGWSHHFDVGGFGDVTAWKKRNVATYIVPSTLPSATPTVEGTVYPFIDDMGKLFGIADQTTDYIHHLQQRMAWVKDRAAKVRQKKTVIILQSHGNGRFTLYGNNYLISQLVADAGGINLCTSSASLVGAETVLSYQPDIIIFIPVNLSLTEELRDEAAIAQLTAIYELRHMNAIEQRSIIPLSFFTVNNAGIRTVDTVEYLNHTLYP